jgi:glycosyltransferase involved in cell wall biosynthesis
MRVLFTHELFPPDLRGGGELIAFQAAKAMQAAGVDTRVLTTGDPRVAEHEGIPTKRLPISRYRMNLAAREIAKAAADADVIQTFNYHACLPSLWAARRLKKPIVAVALGLFGAEWRKMRPFPAGLGWQLWEKYQIEAPFDYMVFISDYSLRQAQESGMRPRKPLVLYPGIEEGKYLPQKKEDAVLFTGKFDDRKGVFEVLQVARALPEVRFWMYGWGPEEAALRREAPPNVEITTYSSPAALELPDLVGRARICLLPSKAETFGIALAQCMAAGCAVVSSIPLEFAGHRTGADDVAGMTAAVKDLWTKPAHSLELGQRNVQMSRQYTWQRFAAGLISAYEQALKERRS